MKKSLKRIKTVLTLNWEESRYLHQAISLLIAIRMRMALTSFPQVLSWIRKKNSSLPEEQLSTPERLAWMIESIGTAFPHVLKCLPRALAGFMLLRKCGWDITLKIGARHRDDSQPIEAHAWIEKDGKILIGELSDINEYAVFEAFEGKFL